MKLSEGIKILTEMLAQEGEMDLVVAISNDERGLAMAFDFTMGFFMMMEPEQKKFAVVSLLQPEEMKSMAPKLAAVPKPEANP